MSDPIPNAPPLVAQFQQAADAQFPEQPVDPTAVLVGADLSLDLNQLGGATKIGGGGIGISGATPHFPPICGFKFPLFLFALGFQIPSFDFPPKLPVFRISIGINCALSNPINISAKVPYGGGRVPTFDPDPDLALDEATS